MDALKDQKKVTMPIGVAVERQPVNNPWIDHRWLPVAAFVGSSKVPDWTLLGETETGKRYHAGVFDVTLYRSDTEAYVQNLESARPSIYVVMTDADDPDLPGPLKVSLVTLSPYEAQDYLDSGEGLVEAVPLQADLMAFMWAFCDAHHRHEAFRKRKRDRLKPEEHKFGKTPIYAPDGTRPERGEKR